MSLTIKKGDSALVIAGKEKGKTAKITAVLPKDNKVVLDNVNVVTRHKKPRSQQDKGGLIKKAAPIDASNVMIVCPACDKATRVAHKDVDGKKVRICKKCGASLDKAFAKTVKKQAKAEKAETAEKKTAAKTEKQTTTKTIEKKAAAPKATAQKSKTVVHKPVSGK